MEASLPTQTYENKAFDSLKAHLLDKGEDVRVSGVKGSYPAYLLARAWLEVPQSFLVVTRDNDRANELVDELRFFLGEEGGGQEVVRLFPGWETPSLRYQRTAV